MALDLKKEEIKVPDDANICVGVGTLRLQYSEEEEKRVVRKIDCVILPMVCVYRPS